MAQTTRDCPRCMSPAVKIFAAFAAVIVEASAFAALPADAGVRAAVVDAASLFSPTLLPVAAAAAVCAAAVGFTALSVW